MFNQLESIAMQEKPRTPVLGCYISKALEPKRVNYTEVNNYNNNII
jgi:DNA polymerase gamma 1